MEIKSAHLGHPFSQRAPRLLSACLEGSSHGQRGKFSVPHLQRHSAEEGLSGGQWSDDLAIERLTVLEIPHLALSVP